MSVLGVIPARYGSTRFPGKPLAPIAGVSLVERVWRQCEQAASLDSLVVATEDQRIVDHVESFGGRAIMTSPDHASGTDRLGEVAQSLSHDYYVNIQGDEPLIPGGAIDALVQGVLQIEARMGTIVSPMAADQLQDAMSPNVVKVVRDSTGHALYFSRSIIPHDRDGNHRGWLKHIGIYMYSGEALASICAMPRSELEDREMLEQLRALENGIRIYCVDFSYDAIAVDVPEDIAKVEQVLKSAGGS